MEMMGGMSSPACEILMLAMTDAEPGDTNLKHWRGVSGNFGLPVAPALVFSAFVEASLLVRAEVAVNLS